MAIILVPAITRIMGHEIGTESKNTFSKSDHGSLTVKKYIHLHLMGVKLIVNKNRTIH